MPAWILLLIQLLPSIIKVVKEIWDLIKQLSPNVQKDMKSELYEALKARRFDKVHELLDRLKKLRSI